MPDIAASDVTIALRATHGAPTGVRRLRKSKEVDVTITFGDGALTYPSGGVPLPAFGSFGLEVVLDDLVLTDAGSAVGLIWKYDTANKKLRGYEGDYAQAGDAPLVELDAGSDAPAAQTLKGVAKGW